MSFSTETFGEASFFGKPQSSRPPAIGAKLQGVDETSVANVPGIVKVVHQGDFLGVVAQTEWGAIRAARQLKATWSDWTGLPDENKLWEHVRATKISKDDVTSNVGDVDVALGKASKKQKQEYARARDVYLDSCHQLKAGRTAGEVYDFVVKRFAKEGMDYHHMIAGHSVGAWWHQQEPVISRGNSRVLEDGMVIAMEPHIGHWHIQDMWVVRPNGPQLISGKMSTDKLFECG